MKIKVFILQIFITFAVFVLAGCTPKNSTTLRPSQTTAPSLIPSTNMTASPKPTLVFPPSLTPVPNIQPGKIPQLIAALQDDTCKLPCYLGIVPGKTKLQEGIAILENLGGIYTGPYQRKSDGALTYTYEFGIGGTLPEETLIDHYITLITDKDTIQIVEFGAGPFVYESLEPATTTYQTYWKRYSLKEIFLQMGEPENIYSYPKERPNASGASWLLVYAQQSIEINLFDSWSENKLCPGNEVKPSHMTLSYPDSPFSIYADGRVPPTDREVHLPIEEMFGVTVSNFYERVLADPSVCFESKMPSP